MAIIEVKMPQLGESVHEGTIGKWLKQVGEPVKKYEPLLEVITDKVDSEVTAADSGILQEILVPEGETVKVGTVLARIVSGGEVATRPAGDVSTPEVPQTPSPQPQGVTRMPEGARAGASRISPVVARIAEEHGVDLSQVAGTGREGRITKQDILAYIEQRERRAAAPTVVPETPVTPPPAPQPPSPSEITPVPAVTPPPPFHPPAPDKLKRPEGEIEAAVGDQVVKLTPMRKAIAEHMVRSLQVAAQVTTVMEADMNRVVSFREKHKDEFQRREGFNLTYTPFFIQATVNALRAYPYANSTYSADQIILKRQINIGVAVALEDGLIVPVIKDADEKSLLRLAREVNDLATRAREHRLSPDDVQGATFTITNHGVSGSLFATPIINQPNAAILGIGKIQKRVVVIPDDAIAIRPMCYLSLTFDHRIMDGVAADNFLAKVVEELERGEFKL